MNRWSLRITIILSGVSFLWAGCAPDPRLNQNVAYLSGSHKADPRRANFDNVSYWDGDGVEGSPSLRISLGEQRVYLSNTPAAHGALSIRQISWVVSSLVAQRR